MTNEPNKSNYPKPMSFTAIVFWTGLFGGIFWATIGFFAYYFNFTEIRPNIILEPWALGNWKNEWLGTVISIFLIGLFSVGAAFAYYVALKTINGIWIGLLYGIVLFLLVFFVLNPLFPSMKPLFELSLNTLVTTVCIYLVYGLFIGYSINYEYQNTKVEGNEAAS